MRILHFISAPAAGGAEIYVKDLAKSLTSSGHEVHIGFLSSAKHVNRSTSFEIEFLHELDASGIKYFFAGDAARKKPWQGILKVRKHIKENLIDVYHSHLFYGVVFGAFSRIPRIYTHHIDTPRYNKFIWALINFFVDEVVGISQVCYDNILCVLRNRGRVIFNGVNPKKFEGLQKERNPEKHFSFISVGRITDQKNYELLIDAIGLLPPETLKKCTFSIAGEGSDYHMASLKAQRNALSIEKSIHFLGNVNDVPREMLKHDVFLMTSAFEGLPIALIEATISGLPCLLTDAGGCKEVINACKNGVILSGLEPTLVAQGIALFVNNAELVKQYSKASLEKASLFSIDISNKKHIEMYTEKIKN